MKVLSKPLVNKVKAKGFKLNVRSRHPSHASLKNAGIRLSFRSVVRFGSSWAGDGQNRVEINSVDAVRTSANKQLMKNAFAESGVITAMWLPSNQVATPQARAHWINQVGYPIVAKHIHGSRGTGNYLLKSAEELNTWLNGKTLQNYIFEKFYDFNREYRVHVTKDGAFYACRKMLKKDTPDNLRWFRNDSNSVWITEFVKETDASGKFIRFTTTPHPEFDKPINWNNIVSEAVKAITAVGLDVGAVDIRVQSAKNSKGTIRTSPEFIILETNSAPAFAEITLEMYKKVIPDLLRAKQNLE